MMSHDVIDVMYMFIHSMTAYTANVFPCSIQTALHLATHTQQHELVRKLLVSDASLCLTDHKGNTPLHVVCRFSSSKCLEEILRLVKLSTILEAAQIRNNEGLTCIHIAVQHKNTDALRKLKSIGVDVNMQVWDKCSIDQEVSVLWF